MTLLDDQLPAPSSRRISYKKFLSQYREGTHAEWVDGEIIEMAPISDEHQYLTFFLIALLNTYVAERNLGLVLGEPFQMKIGPDLPGRSPDIIFVSNANRKRIKKTFLDGPADLVVEVISPESRGRDRGDKFYEYEKGGVKEYWLLDPLRKQAEFYRRGTGGIFTLMPLDEQLRFQSKVLVGLWLKPEWFWRQPFPSLLSILKQWKLA